MTRTTTIAAVVIAVLLLVTPGHGNEPMTASPENIRTAQDLVLARIVNEANTATPEELLRLSQTLSALQGVEGGANLLQISRAVEPQLQVLPGMSQAIQKQVITSHLQDMLQEFTRRPMDREMLPYVEILVRGWGYSLDMLDAVNVEIQKVDAQIEGEREDRQEKVITAEDVENRFPVTNLP